MYTTHTSSDRASGIPMRAVAGIWNTGRIPGMLQRKMKMNSDSRNGVHLRPCLPIVCMTMPSSMNSIIVSARLREPVGAFIGSRRLAARKSPMPINAASTAISPILLNDGKMSCQRKISLIGGKTSPLSASTLMSVSVEVRVGRSVRGAAARCGPGLEPRMGERHRHVLHLPEEESEVRDDDGRSECRKRNPRRVLDEPDGEEDQTETDQVAEQGG